MHKDQPNHPYKGVFAAVALIAVIIGLLSAGVNGWFGWQTGKNTAFVGWMHWGYVAALGSGLFDILKDFLPILVVMALTRKGWDWRLRLIAIVAPTALWIPLAYNSWTYASGAAMLIQSNMAGVHSTEVEDKRLLMNEKKSLSARKNGWAAETKEPTAIESEIQAHMLDPKWRSAGECVFATNDKERAYCKRYHELVAAKKLAERQLAEQKKTDDRLTAIEEKLSGMAAVLVTPETASLPIEDEETRASKAHLWAALLEGIPTGLPVILYVFAVLLTTEAEAAAKKRAEEEQALAAIPMVAAKPARRAAAPKIALEPMTEPEAQRAVEALQPDAPAEPLALPKPSAEADTRAFEAAVEPLTGDVALPAIIAACEAAAGRPVDSRTVAAFLRGKAGVRKLETRASYEGKRAVWYAFSGAGKRKGPRLVASRAA